MFNFMYLFLYNYSYLLNKPLFNCNKSHLATNANRVYGSLYKYDSLSTKQKKVILIKKKFFFYKFASKPAFLLKKLLFVFMSKRSKSTEFLLRGCFKTIYSKRPLKCLYYKISRSRSIFSYF